MTKKGKHGGARRNSGGPRANSGGPRPNSGGARPGAGRKPLLSDNPALQTRDPEAFLRGVMADAQLPLRMRMDAAHQLLRGHRQAGGTQGKKQERQEAAERAAQGRFKPGCPPELKVVQ